MPRKKRRTSIDDYFTIPAVIKFLGVPKATVYYWMKINQLPSDWFFETKVVLKKDAVVAKKAIDENNLVKS